MSKDKTMTEFILPAMRGKVLHKYMAQKVAERFVSLGFEVSAEYPTCLADGVKDYTDLLVSCGVFDLAIEIETTPRNVLTNAIKADNLGFRLWIVAPNKKISSVVARKLRQAALSNSRRIRVLTLGQFLNLTLIQIIAWWKGG